MINESRTLAVALGANLPSTEGPPISTLIAVRPKIQEEIVQWLSLALKKTCERDLIENCIRWRWSPLFETEPLGSTIDQPDYINAVLVVDGPIFKKMKPSKKQAKKLLKRFLKLEKSYGRDRENSNVLFGPRTLDIDLLGWGGLNVKDKLLTLPHPRIFERNFVVVPLGEALNQGERNPRKVPPQEQWE